MEGGGEMQRLIQRSSTCLHYEPIPSSSSSSREGSGTEDLLQASRTDSRNLSSKQALLEVAVAVAVAAVLPGIAAGTSQAFEGEGQGSQEQQRNVPGERERLLPP